jgi:hypothetical protein
VLRNQTESAAAYVSRPDELGIMIQIVPDPGTTQVPAMGVICKFRV